MPEISNDLLVEINIKLDRITRLLALNSLSPDQSMKEKTLALNSAGLSPKEIAELIGSTAHSVSQTLSVEKKKSKKATGKKKK